MEERKSDYKVITCWFLSRKKMRFFKASKRKIPDERFYKQTLLFIVGVV